MALTQRDWPAPRTLAWAGLGQMGRALVARLRNGAAQVVGVDPDMHARAAASNDLVAVASLREAGRVDAVLACVPGPPELDEVVAACLALPERPRYVVNLSTVGPAVAQQQRARLRAAHPPIAYVEAPVSGGVLRAARGEAVLLCAVDPPEAMAAVRPTLELLAARVIDFPTVADASAAKLANNLAILAIALGTLEALEWGVRAGLPFDALFDALEAGTADSYALRSTLTRSLRDGDFARGFAMRLALKDVRLALDAPAAADAAMPFAREVARRLEAGCEFGLGDYAFPAVAAATPQPALGWTQTEIAGR